MTSPEPPTGEPQVSLEIRYQAQKEILLGMLGRQFDYGKWVVASLVAIHGGSLLAIGQFGDSREKLVAQCGALLFWGLAAAVIAGAVAWLNFTLSANFHWKALNTLRDGKVLVPDQFHYWGMNGTMVFAAIAVLLSLGLFVTASIEAQHALRSEEPALWYQTETTADDPK
jgi:uncharacterized membrane protein YjgN (DUF898 family)